MIRWNRVSILMLALVVVCGSQMLWAGGGQEKAEK